MLGEELRIARKAKGYTQEEVASFIGTSRVFYTRLETGTKEPSVKILVALSKILNVSIDGLLEEEKSKFNLNN